nr:NADH dehydrogenase subunit 2 [Potamopyrgus kaitunuparaoa]
MYSSLPFSLSFLSLMAFGTLFSISSSYWLGIWAGLEINLIGFLPLLVYQKTMSESESAVKYFIIQAMGSSLLMFGSLLIYSLFFTWEVFDYMDKWVTGFMIISMGLMMKMGVFPFYFWLPSVMAGLSWFSCLLLATWQKVAPLFLMVSFLDGSLVYWIIILFCLLSVGSSFVGGFGGMNQTQLRALVAYSSIGHLGWMLFAILHSSWAMKVYLSIYILISFCIFMGLWYSNLSAVKTLNSSLSNTLSMSSIMVMFLSLGGLPPMLGFVSKWIVISSGTALTLWGFLMLLVVGSVMSLFYYLSLIFSLFLSSFKNKKAINKTFFKAAPVVVFGLFLNIFGGVLLFFGDFLWMY